MFPYPSGDGPARRPPAGLHRHRRLRPLPAHDRPQRAAHDGLRRLRPARRAVRGADRPAPPRHHRAQHRHHAPPAAARWAWATTRAARRRPPTTRYYRWTQWIFLQIFNVLVRRRGRPGPPDRRAGGRAGRRHPRAGRGHEPLRPPVGRAVADVERRRVVDDHRLAYLDEAPVNWCPGLGTVLANEEVTADGRSERGNFPVFRRPLKQWMMRITAYADRLIDDLDLLDWPEPIKLMQRNWIGRSDGRPAHGSPVARRRSIEVFTTRPDTLFGATYMVLAPEHPLVERADRRRPGPTARRRVVDRRARHPGRGGRRLPAPRPPAVRARAPGRGARARPACSPAAYATNPVNGDRIPVFIADYVLMGYGTGAIMAVPGQDQRDWDFAEAFDLPIVRTVQPPDDFDGKAYIGDGPAINSRRSSTGWRRRGQGTDHRLARGPAARATGTVTYKLRDWLFSRQRYWGEPFPIVYDEDGLPRALPESELPVDAARDRGLRAAHVADDDETRMPEPPLGRATEWVDGRARPGRRARKVYRRELNTMPQWAGSCWYELRYLDPTNDDALRRPRGRALLDGPADARRPRRRRPVRRRRRARRPAPAVRPVLAQGPVRPGPRQLLAEPFRRLFNQGYIQAAAYTDERGFYVEPSEVDERDGGFFHGDRPVTREFGKMGKSLKNSVTPDEMYDHYGADTLRLYEMFMGPLDQSRPWDTTAVVGVYRLLQRIWRRGRRGDRRAPGRRRAARRRDPPDPAPHDRRGPGRHGGAAVQQRDRQDHRAEQPPDRHATPTGGVPREVAEPLVLMLAPLAPHIAEELWSRLGHDAVAGLRAVPRGRPGLAGGRRGRDAGAGQRQGARPASRCPPGADAAALEAAARADDRVAAPAARRRGPPGRRRARAAGQLRRRLTSRAAPRRRCASSATGRW